VKADEIRRFLSGQEEPVPTLTFLTDEFISAVVNILNEPATRRRMALYGGDRIPENERNLTDVRNRMSLLIEYKLSWVANDILESYGITDLFWTNVVANRFPDLELRDTAGHRGLRIEVKCLQAVAEEKAANFDTLKKDLNPSTDYIVVFIWEWFRDKAAVGWDRAPKILRAFVFHASSLAELRDYNWLSNPPGSLGDGFQGFDLKYAVNCRDGVYNEEEGNYGKLLRIWDDKTVYHPNLTELLRYTVVTYKTFEDFTVWSGFDVLAQQVLGTLKQEVPKAIVHGEKTIGYYVAGLALLFKRYVGTAKDLFDMAKRYKFARIIVMTDKYQWVETKVLAKGLLRGTEGRKPKHLVLHLSGNLAPSDIV
jgi:hypothetical protein